MDSQPEDISSLTRKERKDLKILALFTSVYCKSHHHVDQPPLTGLPVALGNLQHFHCCAECRRFLLYAIERRLLCPLEPKPLCKHCQLHCYRSGHREMVREIMRFSGKALIRRGRIDLLWHYLF